MKVPFGKYKDEDIIFLYQDYKYFDWFIENCKVQIFKHDKFRKELYKYTKNEELLTEEEQESRKFIYVVRMDTYGDLPPVIGAYNKKSLMKKDFPNGCRYDVYPLNKRI